MRRALEVQCLAVVRASGFARALGTGTRRSARCVSRRGQKWMRNGRNASSGPFTVSNT